MENRYPAYSELRGPCDACGKPATAPIPQHFEASDATAIGAWPSRPLPGLSCPHCSQAFPLAPVTCVYWCPGWVGLVLDGPRPATEILRMVLSWIADDSRIKQVEHPAVVRVFCPLSSFAYYLRTGAGTFITDVRSLVIPHWDDQRIALTQFLDDALALDEPVLAYGFLANVIESHPELYFDHVLRESLELIAHACADAPIMPESVKTALDHFGWLKDQMETHRPFSELDQFQIRFETPLTLDTERPIEGAYNGVEQGAPQPTDICDVGCRLLVAVAALRSLAGRKGRSLKSALTAEHKARMFVRSLWPLLEDVQRQTLRDLFEGATGSDLEQTFAIR